MLRDYRIETGLKGKKYCDILKSVMGQLSDGIWENRSAMNKYWQNQAIEQDENGNVYIISSSYLFENPTDCKKFFARKIKQIVKIERDWGSDELTWERGNENATCYIRGYGSHHKENDKWIYEKDDFDILVGDCYYAYDVLMGRDTSKFEYAKG